MTALVAIALISGCGGEEKQATPGPALKQEASPPAVGTPPPRTAAASSCYDIGFKTGRCAAKTMSNQPCEPDEDVRVPSECKGKAETEKGLVDGRKSVY